MSTRQMEISEYQLDEARLKYWSLVVKLPLKLYRSMPDFEKFLSPANYTNFSHDWIQLSITGTQRYKMLQSPHAVTLLAMYAAKRI